MAKLPIPLPNGIRAWWNRNSASIRSSIFQDNIRSIQNVYMGGYNVEAVGLDEFVNGKASALDQRFQTEIRRPLRKSAKFPSHSGTR